MVSILRKGQEKKTVLKNTTLFISDLRELEMVSVGSKASEAEPQTKAVLTFPGHLSKIIISLTCQDI